MWHCKLCSAHFTTRTHLFKHCKLQHSHFSRISPLPCLHDGCTCTFQTLCALSTHLSRYHSPQHRSSAGQSQELVAFSCSMCSFQQPFSESVVLRQIRSHLKKHETVRCPYIDCNYSTNVYSSFNSHKSRQHIASAVLDFCNDIVCVHSSITHATTSEVTGNLCEEGPGQSTEHEETEECDNFNLKDHI